MRVGGVRVRVGGDMEGWGWEGMEGEGGRGEGEGWRRWRGEGGREWRGEGEGGRLRSVVLAAAALAADPASLEAFLDLARSDQ